ncbi:MAG: flavin-containing monooxygenase [Hyphomicrobiaceae bacterium]
MRKSDVVIIGGGQAGLVISRSLSARGIDHVVLERGRIGEHWLSARWNSLHLLSPTAFSTLPGLAHSGADPNGFLPAGAFAAYLARYARAISAPVVERAEVVSVAKTSAGFLTVTTCGTWQSRAVIVATGACDTPYRPAMADRLARSILQLSPSMYRAPDQLRPGGVLIVGASSTGIQLAEEIHASGRPVMLSVGDHTRMPRRYRGRDIYDWMNAAGILDDRADSTANLEAARRQASLQLVGSPDNRDLNLDILRRQGVRLVGRLTGIEHMRARFDNDLGQSMARAHARMLRVLRRIDAHIEQTDPAASCVGSAECDEIKAEGVRWALDLQDLGIRTVIWATGYIRRYPWLTIPVLSRRGEIEHRGGVTAVPGLYVLGLTFLRRRRSAFIDGCGRDAEELAPLVHTHLGIPSKLAA